MCLHASFMFHVFKPFQGVHTTPLKKHRFTFSRVILGGVGKVLVVYLGDLWGGVWAMCGTFGGGILKGF